MPVRILIVEDDMEYLNLIVRRLNYHNEHPLDLNSPTFGEPDTASNVATAIAQLDADNIYDVIVVDMRLDGNSKGGFDLVEEVRNRKLAAHLIILTANDTVEDCREALRRFGCWDYISKTMTDRNALQELVASIGEAINQRLG